MSSPHTQGFDHNFWSWWDFNKSKTILQSPFPVGVLWGRKEKHNSTMQIQNLGVCLKTKFIHFFCLIYINVVSWKTHLRHVWVSIFSSGILMNSLFMVVWYPPFVHQLCDKKSLLDSQSFVVPQIHKESRKESAFFPHTTYKSGKKLLNNHFWQKSLILSVFLCFFLNIINDCVFFLFCLLFCLIIF